MPDVSAKCEVSGRGDVSGFASGAAAWLKGLGGLRNTVRQELVARQLDEQLAARFPVGQRLRVLDVGMGQGTQALRLARAGHKVTGLESDAGMLQVAREALAHEPEGIRERFRMIEGDGRDTGVHFLPGSFDVVLCHGVLMYVEERDAMLAGLARMLAPGGLLSLLVRNADALAMRSGLSGDWDAALTAFDTDTYTNRLGLQVRGDRLASLTATLAGIAAPLHAWYGVRVFTDTSADDAEPPSGDELTRLLAAEDRAGRSDPYRSVAALLHLCGVRGQ
ncbi:Methyltransferase domain-containing protein [Streptomyces wuyuanensis]|uniref:Methyltransferase domain-containing protein n=1 Tax=Streptomyces wuyuanensis TaxID=1196353 RepID=A0A1H0AE12_9ACTN|nr:Methyltransferase domain-containing protein [Streptomyces wuyuanensis]